VKISDFKQCFFTFLKILANLGYVESDKSVINRINKLSPLKQVMIWKEILSPPAGLREPVGDLF